MKTKIAFITLVFFIATSMLLVSCGQQKAKWKGTIEEQDGVIIIKNPAEPIYSNDVFRLEEDLSIGNVEEDEEEDYYDVFDSEGKYIVRISLKYTPLVWKNKKLYMIEEDEEGFQIVKRYKVTWDL